MEPKLEFTEEELVVDEGLGYPEAYAKICRNPNLLIPYANGPPFLFAPYTLQPQEVLRAKELNQMFPVIDPEANPSENPRIYVNLLWKQLDHLGNAGFDPAFFRLDPYGNVLYYHADPASPLAWDIDHWFPRSRGGSTVSRNLRILQSQVCRKKQNKLEFLIPWWDLQLGISVNQFLSIFASRNSDFRNRAFVFMFLNGGSEEINGETIDSHIFPKPFIEKKRQVGLAPAPFFSRERSSDASVLKALDPNLPLMHNSLTNSARKFPAEESDDLRMAITRSRPTSSKENVNSSMDGFSSNPHLSITMARDSLRHREETKKKQGEMSRLEDELKELKQKNEAERVGLQELEVMLLKRRRRVEKCRRLAEAQSSYRAVLEKMIRDAMHQSVVYKEQLKLNQSATGALMARLEAQRSICDSSETELRRKFRQRDEMEKQIRPFRDQARKRSRIEDCDALLEERGNRDVRLMQSMKPLKKELREFLEEAKKASEAELSLGERGGAEIEEEESPTIVRSSIVAMNKSPFHRSVAEDEKSIKEKLKGLEIIEQCYDNANQAKISQSQHELDEIYSVDLALVDEQKMKFFHEEDGSEFRDQVGKGNVEKWLQILLANAEVQGSSPEFSPRKADRKGNHSEEIVRRMNLANPQKEIMLEPLAEKSGFASRNDKQEIREMNCSKDGSSRKSFDTKERKGGGGCESSRGFRSLPSSPSSVIFGMRKSVDCMGKKPKVIGDDESIESFVPGNKFIKSCTKAIKKAVHK